jgi:L-histidine N-alpha-methyltransferase
MIVLGIDLKKNPVLIQNAYFNNPFEFQFLMNSIARINRDLNGNFNLEKFYPHSFYNPKEGMVRGCLISKETQTIQIENSTFNFEEHEVISVCRSRKWLLSEVEKLMAVAGMKLKGYLEDANSYFREVVF